MSDFDADRRWVLQFAAYLSSGLSLAGIGYVLVHYAWQGCMRWRAKERQTKVDFNGKLVLILSIIDLIAIASRFFGQNFIQHPVACNIQAALLDGTGLASCLWISCMAFNLYAWIVTGDSITKREARFSKFVLITFVPSIAFVVYHIATGMYGDATFFCWIADTPHMFYQYYSIYLALVLYNLGLLLLVRINMQARRAWFNTVEADTSSMLIRRKILMYAIVFILHRAPMMFYRVVELYHSKNFEFAILAQVILNLDGFSNSIVYGGLCQKEFFIHHQASAYDLPGSTHCRTRSLRPCTDSNVPSDDLRDDISSSVDSGEERAAKARGPHEEDAETTGNRISSVLPSSILRVSAALRSSTRTKHDRPAAHACSSTSSRDSNRYTHHLRSRGGPPSSCSDESQEPKLSIFTSTFNMGEAKITDKELSMWIPTGYEIYVIGVQECMDLADLQNKVLQHLVVESGDKYVYYSREIGKRATALGYHGYIALSVFVKEESVAQNTFQMSQRQYANKQSQEVFRGKSLLVFGRASNKGAVGMSFRYKDTSFAFVTCHLASDSTTSKKISSKSGSKFSGMSNLQAPASMVERRNLDAMEILQQLYLDEEDYGFGFSQLHHHSFILGDFNYRMTRQGATPAEMVTLLEQVGGAVSAKGLPTPMKTKVNASTNKQDKSDFHECCTPRCGETGDANEETSRGSNKITFSSLVQHHDELTHILSEKQLFHGFQEAPIGFYPTFRRIRRQSLVRFDHETLNQNYSLVANHGGFRVPSYTDRILYASLAGESNHIRCVAYDSCEAVQSSDHKPVMGVFEITLRNDHVGDVESSGSASHDITIRGKQCRENIYRSLTSTAIASGRMKDVPGACEMKLRMDYRYVRWHALDEVTPTTQLELGFLFPIPCEDVFAQQRKLHEIAEQLTWGNSSVEFAETQTPSSNFHCLKWTDFVVEGLQYLTVARRSGQKHVAVVLRGPSLPRGLSRTSSAATSASSMTTVGSTKSMSGHSSHRTIGHGTFCVEVNGRKQDVAIPLTLGGQLLGQLHVRVSLRVGRQHGALNQGQ